MKSFHVLWLAGLTVLLSASVRADEVPPPPYDEPVLPLPLAPPGEPLAVPSHPALVPPPPPFWLGAGMGTPWDVPAVGDCVGCGEWGLDGVFGPAVCIDKYLFGLLCGFHSTCNMPLHYAYFPAHHGYYYFRPYNYVHVPYHQALAPSLLGDWRMPYATLQFDTFYAELGVTLDELPGAADPLRRPLLRRTRPLPRLEDLLEPAPPSS